MTNPNEISATWPQAALLALLTLAVTSTTCAEDEAAPPCATPAELSKLSGTIVYEGDPIEGADPKRDFDIWVIGAPDWTPRLLVGSPGFDGHPVWSPDGTRVAYSSHRDRNPDLYVINADGTNHIRLTNDEGRDDYPTWIAEGIVYKRETAWHLVSPDARSTRAVTKFDESVDRFAVSTDGSRIALVKQSLGSIGGYHLFLADASGKIIRQLTNDLPREIHPCWSPDGKQIAYSGGDGRRDGIWDVYLLDVETGDTRKVTTNPGPDWACGWSPDGKWLLITSAYGNNWDIYAIRPDGSGRLRITCHAGDARYASWTAAEPLKK